MTDHSSPSAAFDLPTLDGATTITYCLRLPGIATRAILVEATSFAEALATAKAPKGTTGNGLLPGIAEQMVAHGIATRFSPAGPT